MTADPPRRYYSVVQVADAMQVTPETVRRWITDRHLYAVRLGSTGHYRIAEDDLAAFVDGGHRP